MSFDDYIQQLENEYKFLQSQILITNENWRDFVKEKFFNEHFDSLPYDYSEFISELQSLSQSLDCAQIIIDSLND
jgi:hypothetical protein